MRKISLFCMMTLLALLFVGCDNETESSNNSTGSDVNHYIATVEDYIEKLDDLITTRRTDNTSEDESETFAYHTPTSGQDIRFLSTIDTSYQHTKEDFLDVYNKQTGYQATIDRTEFLMLYRDLLDEVVQELKEEEVITLDTFIEIDFAEYGDVSIYCGFSNEDEIIVKMEYNLEENTRMTAFKSGYNEDDFYVKEINYSSVGNNIAYIYSEFFENDYFMYLNYSNNDKYHFGYHSERENTEFSLSKSDDIIEGDEQAYGGYFMRWYDEIANIRYSLGFNEDATILSEHYEVFNDHAVVFSYMDSDTTNEKIRIEWNMLEASGWDYVIADLDGNYADYAVENPGIYKDGMILFRIYPSLNEHYANLRVEKEFIKDDLTNEVLNLTAYGLTFSMTELNLSYIDSIRNTAAEEAQNPDYGYGIDFFEDHIGEDFLSKIDEDLVFNHLDYEE